MEEKIKIKPVVTDFDTGEILTTNSFVIKVSPELWSFMNDRERREYCFNYLMFNHEVVFKEGEP